MITQGEVGLFSLICVPSACLFTASAIGSSRDTNISRSTTADHFNCQQNDPVMSHVG